jgi:hypothetical protein
MTHLPHCELPEADPDAAGHAILLRPEPPASKIWFFIVSGLFLQEKRSSPAYRYLNEQLLKYLFRYFHEIKNLDGSSLLQRVGASKILYNIKSSCQTMACQD